VRIIGGLHKGRTIRVPRGLPVRPTTDFAKEGLFNMLGNRLDFDGMSALDLFSGTGHISLEFASRGCGEVTAVDVNARCAAFLRETAAGLGLSVHAVKADVFAFLKNCHHVYDLVFADPPYDLENISDVHKLVKEHGLLKPGGLLIIEHGPRTSLDHLPGFIERRKYGNVNFSFFN
jgi:16S rRNA (guanine966-N2)-methyltransferase